MIGHPEKGSWCIQVKMQKNHVYEFYFKMIINNIYGYVHYLNFILKFIASIYCGSG
jgi:hypothetical protein